MWAEFSPLQPIDQLTADFADFTKGSTLSVLNFKSVFVWENIDIKPAESVKCLTVDDVTVPRSVDIKPNFIDGIFKPVLRILVTCQINTYMILEQSSEIINPVVLFKYLVLDFGFEYM